MTCAKLTACYWGATPPSPWVVYVLAVQHVAFKSHRHGIKGR